MMEIPNELVSLIAPGTAATLRRFANADTTTLEIGTGPGQYSFVVPGRFIGLDKETINYRPGVPRRVDVAADAAYLPFADASFDIVFYAHTFLNLPKPYEALAECRRVLRPAGRLLIFDYTRRTLQHLRPRYEEAGEHISLFRATEWVALLEVARFNSPSVRLNSVSWKATALRCALPHGPYHRVLDAMTGSIVVTGRR